MAKRVTEVKFRTGPMTRRRHIEDQDEKYHYHYARNDPDRVRDLVELFGYEIVRREQKTNVGDKTSLDGAVTAGGDVLLRIPIEKWNDRQREKEEANRQQLEGPIETFKTEAGKHGVGTFDRSKRSVGTMAQAIGQEPKN